MSKIITCIFILLCSTAAVAADGYYFLLGGGVNFFAPHKERVQTFANVPVHTFKADYIPGPCLGAGLAIERCNLALEFDYYYLFNNLNQARGPVLAENGSNLTKGYTYSHNFLVNGLWYICQCNRMRPYLGAGAGVSYVHVNQSLGFAFISPLVINKKANSFAYDLFAGVSYCLTECLYLDIRGIYLRARPKIRDHRDNTTRLNYHNAFMFIALNAKI